MHIPSHNAESRPEVIRQFIHSNPVGILTTGIKSTSHPFLLASHIPWVIDSSAETGTEFGKLRGHIARPNPQAKSIIEHLSESPSRAGVLEDDVLVMFNGPVHHYVTPKFYKETKPATGKVVPTWNYESVEVYGTARIYHETKSPEFSSYLDKQLVDLSMHAETAVMGYGGDSGVRAWEVADAPSRYIELLKKNIIGIEIEIKSMAGRFKMSQEKPIGDRNGVIEGFKNLGNPIGVELSELATRRAKEYDEKKQRA